ncbi:MAG: glycosyltransferase family 4 protein [Candidatus Marinimicrobia bacterium]|mgnify:FL=1|nr:glycosyltransferase family 4 protein [Candidatus Neomarinimicrobiota bacterium]MDP7059062.1 glycosyltransferase family 4 protein [Candidatus Neomarinimicrobiota bacterium]
MNQLHNNDVNSDEPADKSKVLLASSLHRWNDVRIFHKEANSLAVKYDVTVMGVASERMSNSGEIRVLTLPRPTSLLRRFLNGCKILEEGVSGGYAIFHFHDPELLWVGFMVKLFRIKVIYDVHEDTRAAAQIREWIPQLLRGILGGLVHVFELFGQWIFNGVILAEDSYFSNFPANDRTVAIRNYVRVDDSALHFRNQSKRILYAGSVTVARGIGDLLDAVAILQREDPEIGATIIGSGPADDKKELEELRRRLPDPASIEFIDYIDFGKLKELAQNYYLAVVPLRRTKNYERSIPTKILDYMNWGLPFVYSRLQLTEELFGQHSGGVGFEPGDVEDLARNLRRLLTEKNLYDQLRNEGKSKVGRFDWSGEEKTLLKLYDRVLGKNEGAIRSVASEV